MCVYIYIYIHVIIHVYVHIYIYIYIYILCHAPHVKQDGQGELQRLQQAVEVAPDLFVYDLSKAHVLFTCLYFYVR